MLLHISPVALVAIVQLILHTFMALASSSRAQNGATDLTLCWSRLAVYASSTDSDRARSYWSSGCGREDEREGESVRKSRAVSRRNLPTLDNLLARIVFNHSALSGKQIHEDLVTEVSSGHNDALP